MSYSSSPGAGDTNDAFKSATSAAAGSVHTRRQGCDFFGHARLRKSPIAAFVTFERFMPNADSDPTTISLVAVGNEHFRSVHPQTLDTGGSTNGIVAWTQFNY